MEPSGVVLKESEQQYCELCNPTNPGSKLGPTLAEKIQHYAKWHNFRTEPSEVVKVNDDGKPLEILSSATTRIRRRELLGTGGDFQYILRTALSTG
jgi:hypothetical protein